MAKLGKVAVVVVSWNGRRHLETLLPALAAQDDPGVAWEVLVLDNGSRDGTAEWVRRHHPRVRLVESAVNLGFCAGNNRLVDAASDADAVALLNNDTRPRRGWLAALVAALARAPQEVAAVSGMIVDWQGERLDFARGVMTFDGHAFQLGFRRPLVAATTRVGASAATPGDVSAATRGAVSAAPRSGAEAEIPEAEIPEEGAELAFGCGGNLLVRRRSFLAAGGFDEDYFAYLEDVDLGWRLWAGGERVLFARDAVVHHRSSATSDLLGLYNRGFLFERNALLTAYKNYEAGVWERMMPAVMLALTARTQHLLAHGNPGGAALLLDPYAGHIADTAPGGAGSPAGPAAAGSPLAPSSPGEPPAGLADLPQRWRRYGTVELGRRLADRLRREIAARVPRRAPQRAQPGASLAPVLTDERTVAQLRATSWLLAHLDAAADRRRAVQARRRVPDREILARFPPYLVPTYPGDEELFASPGFRAWLPEEPKLVYRRLGEVMELG